MKEMLLRLLFSFLLPAIIAEPGAGIFRAGGGQLNFTNYVVSNLKSLVCILDVPGMPKPGFPKPCMPAPNLMNASNPADATLMQQHSVEQWAARFFSTEQGFQPCKQVRMHAWL